MKSISNTLDPANPIDATSSTREEVIEKLPGDPRRPTTVIDSDSSFQFFQLDEIWVHRELLYFLVWRDLKVRYKQTVFGVAWVILQPLLMTIVFTVVLGKLVRVTSDDVPYALFAFSGLTLWVFFSASISITGNCLVL